MSALFHFEHTLNRLFNNCIKLYCYNCIELYYKLYQEIQIQIAFWYIISNSFKFSSVFKAFYDKTSYNSDDASKNGCPRLS